MKRPRLTIPDLARLLPSGGRARSNHHATGVDEPPPQIDLFGGLINTRPFLGQPNGAQEAPDPIKQGKDTPARPARWPIAILTHDQELAVSEGSFVAIIVGPQPLASVPRGRLQADPMRANLRVPPHVAYGSLFVGNDPAPYGLG